MNPFLLSDHLEYSNDQDYYKKQYNNSRSISLIAKVKRLAIEQIYKGLYLRKRLVRLIHYHVDQVEYLERADYSGNQNKEDRRRKQRNRNIKECLYSGRAVDIRRFIIIVRDLLQTRNK